MDESLPIGNAGGALLFLGIFIPIYHAYLSIEYSMVTIITKASMACMVNMISMVAIVTMFTVTNMFGSRVFGVTLYWGQHFLWVKFF